MEVPFRPGILTAHECITAHCQQTANFSITTEQLVKDFKPNVVNGRKHAKAPERSSNAFIKNA